MKAELSRRLQWEENIDRLPEMRSEERAKENKENVERFNRLYSDEEGLVTTDPETETAKVAD